MMSDLMSKGELFNKLATVQTLGEAYGVIQEMPTVDAVPVVRCKDCHQYKPGWCYLHEINMREHDFCSRGKSW